MAGVAARFGLPESAVTGIRFALEPGVGRDAVPVRSAILGATLAVVVVATVTFGASLNRLVSSPALYGWNWDYATDRSGRVQHPRGPRRPALLDRGGAVTGWSGVYYFTVLLDGTEVPVIAAAPGATVAPPLLSGHAVEADDQIVVGQSTLTQLHRGWATSSRFDTATSSPDRPYRGHSDHAGHQQRRHGHTEIGPGRTGVRPPLLGGDLLNVNGVPLARRTERNFGRPSVAVPDRPWPLQSCQGFARATSTPLDNGITVVSFQRPAEIVNYRSMGSTPAVLGIGLAAGAVTALSLTLVASVRRRRRDLALEDIGVHPPAAGRDGGLAVDGGGLDRHPVGCPWASSPADELWALFATRST